MLWLDDVLVIDFRLAGKRSGQIEGLIFYRFIPERQQAGLIGSLRAHTSITNSVVCWSCR